MKNYNYTTVFYRFGQIVGVSAGAITAILWMLTLLSPDPPFTINFFVIALTIIMTILAVVAIVASLKNHAEVLLIIFGVSFFPIGLYLLGGQHWIHWVGLTNIGFLVASIVIWRFRPQKVDQSAQSG